MRIDGQIVVNTTDKETVRLILNGVAIDSSSSAPIYIISAKKTVIIMADNSPNTLTDGTTCTYDVVADEEPNASLDALHSNGGLAVNGGTFTISTADDGIHADAALGFSGGYILITKSYEGIESEVITVNKGNIRFTSSDDGINCADGTSTGGEAGGTKYTGITVSGISTKVTK